MVANYFARVSRVAGGGRTSSILERLVRQLHSGLRWQPGSARPGVGAAAAEHSEKQTRDSCQASSGFVCRPERRTRAPQTCMALPSASVRSGRGGCVTRSADVVQERADDLRVTDLGAGERHTGRVGFVVFPFGPPAPPAPCSRPRGEARSRGRQRLRGARSGSPGRPHGSVCRSASGAGAGSPRARSTRPACQHTEPAGAVVGCSLP